MNKVKALLVALVLSLCGNGFLLFKTYSLSGTVENFRAAESEVTQIAEQGYWLSKAGKRHNYKCKFFKNCEGSKCNKNAGTACGLCGG